jgi:hypothetical protein
MEGPLSKEYEIGKIGSVPEGLFLREIGEKMQSELVHFNYTVDFEGKINILNQEERDYSVSQADETGSPSMQKDDSAKIFESSMAYDRGSVGTINLVTMKFTKFSISPVLNPPKAEYGDIEANRPITLDIADRAARMWFDRIGVDLTGYKLKEKDAKNGSYVYLTYMQELPDSSIQSPNNVKAIVDFWGMVLTFEINIGPTPAIGTKPVISEEMAYEKTVAHIGFPTDYKPKIEFKRAIKRTYEQKNEILYAKDRLIYFADLTKEQVSSRAFIEVDAENGQILQ